MNDSPIQDAEAALDAWTNETRDGLTAMVARIEGFCETLEATAAEAPGAEAASAVDGTAQAEELALLNASLEQMESRAGHGAGWRHPCLLAVEYGHAAVRHVES